MAEYIGRDAAIEAAKHAWAKGLEPSQYIEVLPSADVAPVVLCKDCEKSGVTEFGKRYCKEPMGSFFGCIPVEDDYFCSGGRRKDGGDG